MRKFVLTLVVTLTAAPMALAAPLEPGRFALSGSIDADTPVNGDVHGGARATGIPLATIAGLRDAGAPALPAALTAAGNTAQLRIGSRTHEDIYDTGISFAAEGAYGLNGDREVFGAVRYQQAEGSRIQVGTAAVVNAAGADVAEVPVFGRFGDYETVAVEVGARQYFGSGSWRPYVAGRIGAAFVEEIRASFSIPALNVANSLANVPFYDETTALTVGADIGVSYALGEQVSVQIETGLRYVGELDGNDTAIGGLGLAGINEAGERLSVPVTARVKVAF